MVSKLVHFEPQNKQVTFLGMEEVIHFVEVTMRLHTFPVIGNSFCAVKYTSGEEALYKVIDSKKTSRKVSNLDFCS